ncbi:hypothetical protein PV08_08587 [Exophiala spinifera]|uniref:Uncharacterized protein n=1 Tax=Exophiala spinifera TaxID=91928 RepID=A0A0D2BQI9_9EURO|nr:uncharacterized protein PV08_08587 [Exophiala spinifera]KIW13399.1 hypothetical protein PV08_08587 [Exophiala spinifera]
MFIRVALCIASIAALARSQESNEAAVRQFQPGTRLRLIQGPAQLAARSTDETCSGTCVQCFGTGYINCPNSDIQCYLPGDQTYGIDTCPSSASATSGAAPTSSPGSAGGSETCSTPGASCVQCFGAGYEDCPDGVYCYDPNDPDHNTCPDSSNGNGGDPTTDSQCASQFGSGFIICGTDACYNPGNGESCCQDGYYCSSGYTCSSVVGKCCPSGSSSLDCSAADGGLLSSSSSAFSFPKPKTSSAPSSTSDSGSLFSSASTTSSASSSTGSTVSGSSKGDAMLLAPGQRLLAAAVVGAALL